MSEAPALLDLPVHELERLERAVEAGRLRAPVDELGLRAAGLGACLPHLEALAAFPDHASLAAAVTLLAAAARRHAARPRPQMVWSGPEPPGGRARLTGVVLEQLFEQAEREVFIAGYAFDRGRAVLESLHGAMAARGLKVEIVLDCSREKVFEPTEPAELLARVVDSFFAEVWTFGDPEPALFHDPRTLERRPSGAGRELFPPVSMHAKCVVVDRRRALVGSANFTERARSRNIEVGALLEDEAFAEALLFQWRAVMAQGFVVPA